MVAVARRCWHPGGAALVDQEGADARRAADALAALANNAKIVWHENLGGGSFGPEQVITASASDARSVYATDLDGDGDADVLSAAAGDDRIAWYENLGGGSFGAQQVITTSAVDKRSKLPLGGAADRGGG